jgi:NTP pyrophosphatase (non-canonical NTP hydrolase)
LSGSLSLHRYQGFVEALVVNRASGLDGLLHAAVGMSTEAGEVLDIVKKSWAFNKTMDMDKLRHEAGDLLFYLQFFCNLNGMSIDDLAELNMAKLRLRYPDGYTDKAAQLRVDGII